MKVSIFYVEKQARILSYRLTSSNYNRSIINALTKLPGNDLNNWYDFHENFIADIITFVKLTNIESLCCN